MSALFEYEHTAWSERCPLCVQLKQRADAAIAALKDEVGDEWACAEQAKAELDRRTTERDMAEKRIKELYAERDAALALLEQADAELDAENISLNHRLHSSVDWLRAQTAEAALAERDRMLRRTYDDLPGARLLFVDWLADLRARAKNPDARRAYPVFARTSTTA